MSWEKNVIFSTKNDQSHLTYTTTRHSNDWFEWHSLIQSIFLLQNKKKTIPWVISSNLPRHIDPNSIALNEVCNWSLLCVNWSNDEQNNGILKNWVYWKLSKKWTGKGLKTLALYIAEIIKHNSIHNLFPFESFRRRKSSH